MRRFLTILFDAAIGLFACFLVVTITPTGAAAQTPQRMTYVNLVRGTPPADVAALWADILAKNDTSPDLTFLKKNGNGRVPAQALYAAIPGGLVSILSSPTTCENAGSNPNQTWSVCTARIQVDGKLTRTRACFLDVSFDPLPGQTPQNSYTTVINDPAKRQVTFGVVSLGAAKKDCAIVVRY